MADIVEIFIQKMICSDDGAGHGAKHISVSLFLAILTCLSLVYSTEDLSIRIYGLLFIIIEIVVCSLIAIRVYHQSQHRDMYQRSQKVGIPENYRWKIAMVIKYHLVMSNVLSVIPLLYTISLDWVRMGDPFTFASVDVLPIKTTNVTVYVCKYIVYALPAYFAHLEICFLNVTFMYSTGVVKGHFQILEEQVEEAMASQDEKKLKIAIKHHQQVLKFFEDMKTLYEKPLLISIEISTLYIGLSGCTMIQVIQGFVDPIILGFCIVSGVAGFVTISVYCICASNMYDLHDGILNAIFEHRSCFSRNKSFKQLVLIMMTRATVPLEYRVYSIYIINLNLLVRILKLTYTLLNVLLTSVNRQFNETAK
ncbi:uncharacterized protein LOC115034124 [Acyrthosiphon pisum]|uniref:Odorant receptor n=1 Tax=Acyrthosiphon pisum TaxID=7029 RepID=A0A8R2JSP4_ACYPI|nr:uncharacterized protein LOC115034124 [Acyrthosiphon pisum]